ncbi:NEDD4-binding 2 isoform B [Micractinium conductrix]|uniref:NEDD4-binding 2 isoform B n=1 Tax=Micractinium conductrix TaxID=554055 RepID=A0A2P6VKU6_9CHLO|nr:NEDD4-binding 2 isoform B [Micractinium conductrix]|eukprot:PSC74687.1 NEDD4-binding 2 isoform B [Micractinium conductrix]
MQTEVASSGAPPASPPPKALHNRAAMHSVLFPAERGTKFSGTTEPPCRHLQQHPPNLLPPYLSPNSATAGRPTEAPVATESQATPAPRPRRPTVGASRGWWPSWPVAPTLGVNQLPLGHATTCDVAAPSPPPRCTHGGANTSAWLLTPLSQSSAPESVSADQWSAADNLLDESKYRTPPRTMPTPAAPTGGGAADGALTGTPPVTPFPLLDASAHQANGAFDAAPGSPGSEDEMLAALMPHLAHCLATPSASGASTPGGGEPRAPQRAPAPSPLSFPALPAGDSALLDAVPLRSASRQSQRSEGGCDAAELVAAVEFHLQMFPNLKREVVGDVLQRHSDAPQAGLDTLIMLSACVEDAAGEGGGAGAQVPDAAGWESVSSGSGSDDEGGGGGPGHSWEGGLTAVELAGFEEGVFPDARLLRGAPGAAVVPEAADVLPAEEKRELLKAEFGGIAAAEVEAALAACDGSLFAAAELLRLFVEEDAAQRQQRQQQRRLDGGAHGAAAAAANVPAAAAHASPEPGTSCLPQHARPKVQHLARRFPDVSPESLEVALASAGVDLPTARRTLREAGYTEVAVEPSPAPRELQPLPASLALPMPVPMPPPRTGTGGSGSAGRDSASASAASSPPPSMPLSVPSASPSAPLARLSLAEATHVRNQAIWEQERAQAQRLEQAYRRCFALAADAHNRGDHQAAAEYSLKGREYREQFHEEQGKASRRISKRVNATNGMPRISVDLHGQTVESALATVESGIRSLPESIPGGVVVRYITGKGRHSAGGAARIRPEVQRLLAEHGIPFVEGPGGGWVEATLVPANDEH